MNTNLDELDVINSQNEIKSCKYYTSQEFVSAFESIDDENCDNNCNTSNMSNVNNSFQNMNSANDNFSLLHINSRSIKKNIDTVEIF